MMILEAVQPDAVDPVARHLLGLGLRHAAKQRPRHHIAEHVAPGKYRVLLKHKADAAIDAVDRRIEQRHLAGLRFCQPRDQPQRGRLAAASGTDDGEEFAGRDSEVEILKRGENLAGRRDEPPGDMLQFDGGGGYGVHD